ncbi:hypothetical protein L6452_35231 [Arctium lappa]|uniref:Uncharacterized protein n=1 Tax=Arctium lappa TaxID=4217 RepID=A0ACB8Y5W7_ARCLA|nr:hypothetical protein L6452_35231 [Arctium lappa]
MKPSQPPQNPRERTCSTSTINVITKSPEKITIRTRTRVYEAEEEEKRVINGGATLKDWLLKSPNNNLGDHHAINPTKLQVLNAISPISSSHPIMSSPEVRNMEFYTPRISFSSENRSRTLEKVDENEDEEEDEGLRFTPILKRNGSQKLKKKVSFRFPQEADIFIFYSPKENFEDNLIMDV